MKTELGECDAMGSHSEEIAYNSDERMDVKMNDKQLVCIEYPGIVQNVDKALQTLGGIKAVNKSIKDETKRLEMHFRPADIYCKPACGTSHKTAGVILHVRRRKRQPRKKGSMVRSGARGNAGDCHDDGYEYKVDILGTVFSAIRFEGMCDFQYLPVSRREDGSYENHLDKLVMRKFLPEEDYMSLDAPVFLSPIMFSRFDTPQDYGFLLKRRKKDTTTAMQPSEILAAGRKARQRFTTVVSFTDPIPQAAGAVCLAHALKFNDTGLREALQELFEERPIWPRTALAYRLRHNPQTAHHLKDVLPSVAYFFLTGPWRTFWVRMGYDPRHDPAAKKFQGIDFRRQRGPGESPKVLGVGKKKDYHRKKDVASEINLTFLKEGENTDAEDSKEPKLRDFEFHADVLPPYRQMVYMVCDIFDAEIQALVSKTDGKETTCDERNGWCVPNFTDRCRSIMTRHVSKLYPYHVPRSKKYQKNRTRQAQRAEQMSDSENASTSLDTTSMGDGAAQANH
ncbi:general transcription factor 3C polypeptide 5-like [Babylonia areolata]|uniref:general transcription factor 3C polypeptide 5-like n=1 Tax=Babylonia areolata TaxID=304850 RepID=UPI003FD3C18B